MKKLLAVLSLALFVSVPAVVVSSADAAAAPKTAQTGKSAKKSARKHRRHRKSTRKSARKHAVRKATTAATATPAAK